MTTVIAALGVLALSAQEEPQCDLLLIARNSEIRPSRTFQIALRFKIEPGWHIYWQNPGDTGVATNVDWKLPKGFQHVSDEWSRPHKFVSSGIVSYGHEDTAYLVSTFLAPARTALRTAQIKFTADWLICKESCVIGKRNGGIDLPIRDNAADSTNDPKSWKDIEATLPVPVKHPLTARAVPGFYEIQIGAPVSAAMAPTTGYFYATKSDVADHGKPQTLKKSANGWVLRIPRSSYEKSPAKVLEGVLELGHGEAQNAAYQVRIPIANATTTRRSS